jgi:hypothetical protein
MTDFAFEHKFPAHTTEHDIAGIIALSRSFGEPGVDLVRRLTDLFDDSYRPCEFCPMDECSTNIE